MQTVRCSSIPLAMKCAGSLAGELNISNAGAPADMGSACHAVMQQIAAEHLDELPDLRPVATRFGVELKELGILCWYGLKALRELRPYLPHPESEIHLETEHLTGTADLLDYIEEQESVVVVDYKSGRLDSEAYHQMMGYKWLAMIRTVKAGKPFARATSLIINLREQTFEVDHSTAAQLNEWYEEYQRRVLHWDGTFRIGGHCRTCKRAHDCPAHHALVVSTAKTLMGNGYMGQELAPADLYDLHQQVKVLKRHLEDYDTHLKTVLAAGPIHGSEGKSLYLKDTQTAEIDPQLAWPILAARFTEAEIAGVLSVGKTALMELVGSKAEKGCKGKDQQAMMQELTAAGAVSYKTSQKLTDGKYTSETKEE